MQLVLSAHTTLYNKYKMTYPSVGNKAIARGLSISLPIAIAQAEPSFKHTPICFASVSVKYMLPVTQSTATSSGW